MKSKKLSRASVILALALALGSQAMAARKTQDGGGASSAPDFSTGLMGKWGVGFDSIPGAGVGPNAVDLRYWAADRTAWEGLLAFGSNNVPGGTDAAGKPVNNSNMAFGLGVGYDYAWLKPSENFLVKLVGKASLASEGTTVNTLGTATTGTTTTIGLSGGLGFEAFIPAWPALSVEGSVRLGLTAGSISSSAAGSTTQGTLNLGLAGDGFTPLNVAAHFYF